MTTAKTRTISDAAADAAEAVREANHLNRGDAVSLEASYQTLSAVDRLTSSLEQLLSEMGERIGGENPRSFAHHPGLGADDGASAPAREIAMETHLELVDAAAALETARTHVSRAWSSVGHLRLDQVEGTG